ncbi:decarboxylating cobalt-precorrin-6B (C(15))-methyltransferase [Furfurilactobacillus sp. WILCCON 0119]|uniref:decarboxylating cobalt-precorrin-6B (C(15))-methyltransferase n=1 Tax=Furfurilactobacillus entadae TaxID=2922307 RepID=UPI0035E8312D
MRDDEFLRTKVPMTKQAVRALCIDELDLAPVGEQTVLDIGAGTGSISIQIAKTHPAISVIAVEHTPAAVDIMTQNLTHFGLTNVTLIEGEAPAVLPEQQFDRIFIGGSGQELTAIIAWSVAHLAPQGRLVMNFILMENAQTALTACEQQAGLTDIRFCNMTVASWHALGQGHYFKPNNPTLILSATRKED